MPEFSPSAREVLVAGTPLIDLRAPSETGILPQATRLPILDDHERSLVGKCYKEHGPEKARALGMRLVSGDIKKNRIQAWKEAIQARPQTLLFCWRGGLRSQIAQQWLAEAGLEVPRVRGGYKALRQACLDVFEQIESQHLLVITGCTGCGKTEILHQFPQAVDLEGAAHHRGSAFGGYPEGQPTPVEFEARLAIAIARRDHFPYLLIEDESATIGRLGVPPRFRDHQKRSPLVVVKAPRSERVDRIYQEYIGQAIKRGEAMESLKNRFLSSLERVQKRLGGERYQKTRKLMEQGFAGQKSAHLAWIEILLEKYYDPMYEYSLQKKQARIRFQGNAKEVKAFIAEYAPDSGHRRCQPSPAENRIPAL